MEKLYSPKDTEGKWYKFWEEKGFFRAKADKGKKPYTIVIPPPNITGILHMGHALNNAIQDILIRFNRMRGFEALWMPGTDHAGIATQNVVEKKLRKNNTSKDDIGREKFLEEVWKWREEYGQTIINQLKRLGCSCDWDRTRFTMDSGLSSAVLEVFVKLFEKGYIYRGNYIINWCPRCKTALSDEEAEHRDVDGMLYHIKYPVLRQDNRKAEEGHDHVVIATTRPETMLGDVAVCVNPTDKRYRHLKGAKCVLPILKRRLDVILDKKVDPKFGTGVLKVTPAHDPVDFELGIEHGLKFLNVMNDDATINEFGGEFQDMDRFEARDAIIDLLKKQGLFVKTEPHRHAVGHCYRCHTMVEPRLSKQWFVKMAPLAKPALKAVEKGAINFYPKRWTKVYINWMKNIRDWCISRQIWWGHRIPVYYCRNCNGSSFVFGHSSIDAAGDNPESVGGSLFVDVTQNGKRGSKDATFIVSKTKPDKCPGCGSTEIEQDPDVLDTWFSSWLWPFSTLGWPEKGEDLKYFYPTNTLVTAQEIIFFWVARMIMAGMEFAGDIPFKDIYIHGTVRDDTGTKMSKSLGNIIDPIDIIDKFGTDALRFSIISITAQGQDVFLSPQKFEIGRNFANKIWNASRFVMMNLKEDVIKSNYDNGKLPLSLADRWILSRFNEALKDFTSFMEKYRINDAANRIYDFIWHEFCDWYVELAKLSIDEPSTQVTLYRMLESSLRTLHPIMPFITEDIWQRLPRVHGKASIMVSPWPEINRRAVSKSVEAKMELVINIIQGLRNLRAAWRIDAGKHISISIKAKSKKDVDVIKDNMPYLRKLARTENEVIAPDVEKPKASAACVIKDIEVYVPLKGMIDLDEERKRLKKRHDELYNVICNIDRKLKNKNFVTKAPKEIVEKEKARKAGFETELEGLKRNLASL